MKCLRTALVIILFALLTSLSVNANEASFSNDIDTDVLLEALPEDAQKWFRSSEITPEDIEDETEKPVSGTSSGISSIGSCLEYLCTALNLVTHPGEMHPPSNLPSLPMKSTVSIVPKSKTVHFLPLKRYLDAIMEAALSGERNDGRE